MLSEKFAASCIVYFEEKVSQMNRFNLQKDTLVIRIRVNYSGHSIEFGQKVWFL